MDVKDIIMLIIGIIVLVVVAVFGIIRIIKTPNGQNFTKSAKMRWAFLTAVGAIGGIALIVFAFV
jgi:EamA domain-containing membrane protein RarD